MPSPSPNARPPFASSPSRSVTPSFRLSLSLSLCLFSVAAGAFAQDDTEEQQSPYRPGLVACYRSELGQPATRVDETIAFDWHAAPPDPRLPQGPFKATWTGRLWTQVAGQHRLAIYAGGGRFTLRLAGREIVAGAAAEPQWFVSEPIELDFDRHPLEMSFEKTGQQARLGLYWSGPGFGLEPVPERFLMHDRDESPPTEFERGRRLAAALRCGACHGDESGRQRLLAPALDKLSGNIDSAWLVDWLSKAPKPAGDSRIVRRMPHFGLSREDAADVAAWLVRLPATAESGKEIQQKQPKTGTTGKGKSSTPKPSASEGQRLFLTLGCLACHQQGELGESGLFGGGDLTAIAAKRPPEFFARWLADPASLNRHHRMPVFDLTSDERLSLANWLASGEKSARAEISGDSGQGERLVTRLQCASCHALPGVADSPKSAGLKPLAASSDWSRSCAGEVDVQTARPGYRLTPADQTALKGYYSDVHGSQPTSRQALGRDLLVELNCLACHAREGIDRATNALPDRLQDKLAAVVAIHDEFGKQVPAMTPPALNSVGDKLHDSALADAIERKGPPHRPYLLARMPKFNLSESQLAALTAYFTVTDRIPRGAGVPPALDTAGGTPAPQLVAAGPRLVTTDGFGCTSCHQVGSVLPDKAPLNARGPDLSMLDKRIRREWFSRWCNNPARIVPRMEMPSVQIPVRGVLNDKIDDQLAAVWHILNTSGFEPPEPNPVRVLRLSGVPNTKQRVIVLHDVIKTGDKTYLFPLVIGLPNRHNILFDLETNRLAAWWLGDTARQRTKGKSWYWEQGAASIFGPQESDSELSLRIDGKEFAPNKQGQFIASLDQVATAVRPDLLAPLIVTRVTFDVPSSASKEAVDVRVAQRFEPLATENSSGFRRTIVIGSGPAHAQVRMRLVDADQAALGHWDANTRTLTLNDLALRLEKPPDAQWQADGTIVWSPPNWKLPEDAIEETAPPANVVVISYVTRLPVDRYLLDPLPPLTAEAKSIEIAPGFVARRLPLAEDIMPSGLAWQPDGRLIFSNLKGQVHRAHDANSDGLEDSQELVADGLPTPYGLAASDQSLDVITKYGLLRLENVESGESSWATIVASGWGVTDDYHDWVVGLVRGDQGEYYVGLPCQQDARTQAAAQYRGQLLKLIPRRATVGNSRLFDIQTVSSGHRFPMGLARSREGELFVTDNQGNYNPFNELNHVRPGAHFGFVNANEKERGYKPPRLDKPAIDIPHPWTRSVNGICFLDTPQPLREKIGNDAFGPLEGHLIGCEYDTRQLIRMTLQKVGDTFQGAAYPLSIPPDNVEDGLLGPIVCAVSPRGELYVGNIRDSGWGAGNNVGDIVQIKIEPEKLPCGIAEVRATNDGFTLDFFRPVDRAKAADPANYSLASYRRESTPAYGGPNLDRRIEKIAGLELAPDGKRVTLRLAGLRESFVYEFQLKSLVRGKEPFHPAEAHYTLNRIP